MGNCASQQTTEQRKSISSTARVIHMDGKLQEFKQPIKAHHIISQNPKCFLCSSESMLLDSVVPQMKEGEELQLGQIYFLMPLKFSQSPLSLPDLCALAIKASAALPSLPHQSRPSRPECKTSLPSDDLGPCKSRHHPFSFVK